MGNASQRKTFGVSPSLFYEIDDLCLLRTISKVVSNLCIKQHENTTRRLINVDFIVVCVRSFTLDRYNGVYINMRTVFCASTCFSLRTINPSF